MQDFPFLEDFFVTYWYRRKPLISDQKSKCAHIVIRNWTEFTSHGKRKSIPYPLEKELTLVAVYLPDGKTLTSTVRSNRKLKNLMLALGRSKTMPKKMVSMLKLWRKTSRDRVKVRHRHLNRNCSYNHNKQIEQTVEQNMNDVFYPNCSKVQHHRIEGSPDRAEAIRYRALDREVMGWGVCGGLR